MSYTVKREAAAEQLNISQRTVDRYVKRGKLSYKKIANKVLLRADEVNALEKEFAQLQQATPQAELITEKKHQTVQQSSNSTEINQIIDQKIEKFFTIFNEKEKIINDKDKMIFVLQQRVGELESKIKNMIALPDYSKEKQTILVEKQKLEDAIDWLQKDVKNERTKNAIYLWLLLIVVFIILLIIFTRW